jgi:hypothetical protein
MLSASVSIHSTLGAIWARTCGTSPRPKASYIPAIVRPLSVVGLVLAMGPSRWIVIVALIRQYVAASRIGSSPVVNASP